MQNKIQNPAEPLIIGSRAAQVSKVSKVSQLWVPPFGRPRSAVSPFLRTPRTSHLHVNNGTKQGTLSHESTDTSFLFQKPISTIPDIRQAATVNNIKEKIASGRHFFCNQDKWNKDEDESLDAWKFRWLGRLSLSQRKSHHEMGLHVRILYATFIRHYGNQAVVEYGIFLKKHWQK